MPIEVKYQSQIRPEDLKNIGYYCHKEKLSKAADTIYPGSLFSLENSLELANFPKSPIINHMGERFKGAPWPETRARVTQKCHLEERERVVSGSDLSRRSFLKIAGCVWGAIAAEDVFKLLLNAEAASPKTLPESTQFDLPPEHKLIVVNPGDTFMGFADGNDLQARELMSINGITDPRTLQAGEAIVVPEHLKNDRNRKVDSFDELPRFQPVITRAFNNPDIAPRDDFEDWELQKFNVFARDASLQLPKMLGMGGAYNAGFFRILRPSQREVDITLPLGASGLVTRSSPVCSSNFRAEEEGIVKASTSCGPNGLSSIYLLTRFSDPVFQYGEKQKSGFGKMQYLDQTEEIIRHEMLHFFFGDLKIPPFDTHELIYSLSSFGLTMESDKGFLSGSGFRVGERFYHRDTIEWYLVRQFPGLMAKLFPWAQNRRAEKIPITENDVLTRLQDMQPSYSSWEREYKSPLRVDALPIEERRVVWAAPQDPSEVYWYIPEWNVRWPNLNEKNEGWIEDFRQAPQKVHGTTLYRSWMSLGKSKWGEVPELTKIANAVAYQIPNGYSGQVPNPSYSSAKPVAWWK